MLASNALVGGLLLVATRGVVQARVHGHASGIESRTDQLAANTGAQWPAQHQRLLLRLLSPCSALQGGSREQRAGGPGRTDLAMAGKTTDTPDATYSSDQEASVVSITPRPPRELKCADYTSARASAQLPDCLASPLPASRLVFSRGTLNPDGRRPA